jgi:hypothetical protein
LNLRANFGINDRISRTAVLLGLFCLVVSIVSVAAPVAAAPDQAFVVTTSTPSGPTAPGTHASDNAYVFDVDTGSGISTGTVQFYFCGPTVSATPCAISPGNEDGPAVTVSGGTANSPEESPTALGYYCWSAAYTSNSPDFSDAESTTTTYECFQVVPAVTTTTTVTSPTTTTTTTTGTLTSTTLTTTTTTLPTTTTSTSTSTQTSTATDTSTSTLTASCVDPELTVTQTVTSFTTTTSTATEILTTTLIGTVTSTVTSTTTVTAIDTVPVTSTTTEVTDTTVCATTSTSTTSSSTPQSVPEFPLGTTTLLIFMVAALSIVLLLRRKLGTSQLPVSVA